MPITRDQLQAQLTEADERERQGALRLLHAAISVMRYEVAANQWPNESSFTVDAAIDEAFAVLATLPDCGKCKYCGEAIEPAYETEGSAYKHVHNGWLSCAGGKSLAWPVTEVRA